MLGDRFEEKCKHCGICVANCPGGASKFNEKKELQIFSHHCRYCMHCVDSCPAEAITITGALVERLQGTRDLAAFLDRIDRHEGDDDKRRAVLKLLQSQHPNFWKKQARISPSLM